MIDGLTTRACTGRRCTDQIIDVVLVRKDGERVRHVFDPEEVAGGQYAITPNLLGELEAHHNAALTVGYRSHFASCVDAPQFRGGS